MANPQYVSLARKHWTQHLPSKVAELRQEGMLEQALQIAANQTQERILELMEQGYRHHEAEEVARAEFLLLPPEVDEAEDDEELAEMERAFREQMREPPEPLEPSPSP